MDPARAGRDALIAWATVAALVTGLVRIDIELPAIGHLGSALVAVLFMYAPVYFAWRRGEDLYAYGFHAEPVGRGLATAGAALAVIIPVFALGYLAFYEIACNSQLLEHLVPRGMCSHYGGLRAIHMPALEWNPVVKNGFAQFCLLQWLVVALPEELVFRGLLLQPLQ